MERIHDTYALKQVLDVARQFGETKIWLDPLVGRTGDTPGPYLLVEDLHTALSVHFEPQVSLHWDGDKVLSVKKLDGGAVATFELKF